MNLNVVSVGEVLWDLLPDKRQLGGAPANFAYHAHALGAEACLVSRVGKDQAGSDILRQFQAWRLPSHLLQVDEAAGTGLVTVELAGAGVPQFTIHEPAAWDFLELTSAALDAARRADVICFGSLAQRHATSRRTVQSLVAASSSRALRIFDVNLRQEFYSLEVILRSLELANVFKLNDAELCAVAEMLGLNSPPESQVEELAARFGLRVVAVTSGSKGSLLFQDGCWSRCQARPVDVRDTVGAGDAFTAALAVGLLRGMDLDQVHELATEAACFVCSQAGATPAMPDELIRRFSPAAPRPETLHQLDSPKL
ncbi:MAG: carbohydrate kinase [Verrucomicrobiota bacterium]